ncbi:hypothetical protein FB451DRAFT_1475961 [Mycena latifolia]|nr:hypothetical protein FB451DRAFT_1475961 [Mycena latifolia]
MSVSVCVQLYTPAPVRKRTTSFSCPPPVNPRPRKRLHRTESVLDLAAFLVAPPHSLPHSPQQQQQPQQQQKEKEEPAPVPYTRTLRFYKEQKERRRALLRGDALAPSLLPSPPSLSSPSPAGSCAPHPSPAPVSHRAPQPPPPAPKAPASARSPLCAAAPTTCPRALTPPAPPRAPHPPTKCRGGKAKAALGADLHRRAVTACMRASPAGAKILHMGARLAVGIMSATRELERMCAEEGRSGLALADADAEESEDADDADADADDDDGEDGESQGGESDEGQESGEDADVPMPDAPQLSTSWIVVPGAEREDWEMVDCS